MSNVVFSLANGIGSVILKIFFTIMISIILWFGNQLSQDIRTKFQEITDDIRIIRIDITHLMRRETFFKEIDKVNDRINRVDDKIERIRN